MADDWDPLSRPGHYFSRIARGMTRVGDARLRALGFATAQLPVLTALKDGERRSQAELARAARVEQPTMAQMLARMERDGLVRREPDPADRRSSLVSLTPAALARLPAGREVLRQGNADMTEGLTSEEVATLVSLLRRVLANVDALEALPSNLSGSAGGVEGGRRGPPSGRPEGRPGAKSKGGSPGPEG